MKKTDKEEQRVWKNRFKEKQFQRQADNKKNRYKGNR